MVRHLFVPVWDRFCFATTVAVGAFGRHWAARTERKGCVDRNGWESVMAVDWFCQNAVGPPKWECEAMGSLVWVKCATSAQCVCLIIDSRVLDHGHKFVLGHTVRSTLT